MELRFGVFRFCERKQFIWCSCSSDWHIVPNGEYYKGLGTRDNARAAVNDTWLTLYWHGQYWCWNMLKTSECSSQLPLLNKDSLIMNICRLAQLFGLLACNPLPIHASMQQRQRLKNLDKWVHNNLIIVLCTCLLKYNDVLLLLIILLMYLSTLLFSRFRDSPHGLLIATDVAARGLDIPNVEHVIHYQVPRTAEVNK